MTATRNVDQSNDVQHQQATKNDVDMTQDSSPSSSNATAQNGDEKESTSEVKSVKGIFKQNANSNNDDFLARLQRANNNNANSSNDESTSTENASPAAAPILTPLSSAPSSSSAFEGRVTRSQTAAERGSDRTHGLVGLANLGNTCFMNAALQCMSNTKELKEYFVSGTYKSEINTSNPLGMGGAMAKVFGELLTKLWTDGNATVWHPRDFKTILSRFSPQFIGYAQQDTQELLAFLLDGLHEDLNRIVKKPYIEAPDWEGGGLKEMVAFAHKQWDIYKQRNDSVIVDLFQGQYRSKLVCPTCGKVSIKFDPFMYLTLPIPDRKAFVRKIHFIGLDRAPIEAEMRLTNEMSFDKLKQTLCQWFNVQDAKTLVASDVFSKCFWRIFTDFEATSEILEADVTYVYQLPSPLSPVAPLTERTNNTSLPVTLSELEQNNDPPQEAEEYAQLPVFSVERSQGGRSFFNHSSSYASKKDGFGDPMFVSVPKEKVNDIASIRQVVMQAYVKVARNPTALQAYIDHLASSSASTSTPSDQATNGTSDEWELLNDAKHVTVPDASLDSQKSDENTVAEIHGAGETIKIVPDERSTAAAATTQMRNSEAEQDSLTVQAGPSTLSSQTPSSSTETLFSLHFLVDREKHVVTTTKPDGYDTLGEELEQRAKRLGCSDASSMESSVHVDSEKDKDDQTAQSNKWPLVYSGGAIVCVWTEEARTQFFGSDNTLGQDGWGRVHETFVDPELEADRSFTATKKPKRTLTIEDCLNEFTKEEKLGETDPWYCPSCKEFKQATKKFDLWKVPDILVVHLKRFSSSSGRIGRAKIDSLIDFPVDGFDLTNRVEGAKAVQELHDEEGGDDEEGVSKLMESIGSLDANDDAVESDVPIYDLYAVDNHFGGLGGGHYTAYGKNPEDDKWYNFDDSRVRPVRDVDEVKSSAAYLLFYRRRTTRPIGGKSREKVRQRVKERQEERENNAAATEESNGGQNGLSKQDDAMDTDMAASYSARGQAHLGWHGAADDEGILASQSPKLSTWDYEYKDERQAERQSAQTGINSSELPAYDDTNWSPVLEGPRYDERAGRQATGGNDDDEVLSDDADRGSPGSMNVSDDEMGHAYSNDEDDEAVAFAKDGRQSSGGASLLHIPPPPPHAYAQAGTESGAGVRMRTV